MSLFDKLVVWSLPAVPKAVVGYFSKDYIAGSTMDEALDTIADLNQQGAMATLDLLGEEVTRREQSEQAADTYIKMLEEIDR